HGGHIGRIVPQGELDFEAPLRAVDRYGNCCLFIDEVSFWANNPAFLRLARVWRHRSISLFLTSQKVGRDVEQTIQSCDPTLYVFRCTGPTTLEYFERMHDLPRDKLRSLKVGEHYTLRG